MFALLQSAATAGPMLTSVVTTAIQKAEQVGGSGADKLQSVLQRTELFASKFLPEVFASLQAFMVQVEQWVNAIVSYYNEAKLWFTTAEAIVTGH